MQVFLNPAVRRDPGYRGQFTPDEYAEVRTFYDSRAELEPTRLVALPGLSSTLSLGGLLVKDETARFGLEAFKIAGARFAIERLERSLSAGIVCATAGNHGRAVARAARERGIPCTVFLPAAPADCSAIELRTRHARVDAMRADGARLIEVDGSYEAAVARAAAHARAEGVTVVSDTSWPGYEEIPRLIMLGYTRLFDEAARQWDRPPDVVLIQGGVGGLVCAAANWFAAHHGAGRPFLVACEPASAACLLESGRAGRPVRLGDGHDPEGAAGPQRAAGPRQLTMMAGLRCAEPSGAAWPSIQSGIDAFVAIDDAPVVEAMERLSRPIHGDSRIDAGPSGACGVGTLVALASSAGARGACRLSQSTRAMAIVTEGP